MHDMPFQSTGSSLTAVGVPIGTKSFSTRLTSGTAGTDATLAVPSSLHRHRMRNCLDQLDQLDQLKGPQ
jgi:hypothetical protein